MSEEQKQIIIKENEKYLDEVFDHTKYKIKYVTNYVEGWLYVSSNNSKVKNINFIDCMCNAGIYKNGVIGTPIEVLLLFINFSIQHPEKNYNLFFNDYDSNRMEIIRKICDMLDYKKYNNIKVFFDNKDVNDYLENQLSNDECFGNRRFNELPSTLLYVDPYCFGEVKIENITKFTNKFYSELIFNYFNSDYRRNIGNVSTPAKQQKIIDSMASIVGYNSNMNEREVESLIKENLKGKNIKYSFSYPFRIKTNVELYHIIYATPSRHGMIKLKDSLWNVFNGDKYFRTLKEDDRMTLFDNDDFKEMNTQNFSIEAQQILYEKYKNKTISYENISEFVLEYTMLKESHIINYLLKPLIEEGKIVKKNVVSRRDYKNDYYTFLEVDKVIKV